MVLSCHLARETTGFAHLLRYHQFQVLLHAKPKYFDGPRPWSACVIYLVKLIDYSAPLQNIFNSYRWQNMFCYESVCMKYMYYINEVLYFTRAYFNIVAHLLVDYQFQFLLRQDIFCYESVWSKQYINVACTLFELVYRAYFNIVGISLAYITVLLGCWFLTPKRPCNEHSTRPSLYIERRGLLG